MRERDTHRQTDRQTDRDRQRTKDQFHISKTTLAYSPSTQFK